jgi:hypothetical protein
MPRTEAESKSEVTIANAALHQAIFARDRDKLSTLTDDSFMLTRGREQVTRQQLFDEMQAAGFKYEKPDTGKVSISVYGDTAIVRGEKGSAAQYTITFINQLGVWRAVSMHTSG